MEHDGITTQSFCSGFPWDKATTEVAAAAVHLAHVTHHTFIDVA
jgi:hypothetical protein